MSDRPPDPVAPATGPEDEVVGSPPPAPDYPRYRIEPDTSIRFAGRHRGIRNFERTLASENIVVVKFYLHISRAEQKRRLVSRQETAKKQWKFSSADIEERAFWDDYQRAFEDALNATSSAYAPWYVVPSDKKWFRNLVIARTIADTLEAMDPQFPPAEEGLDEVVVPD
jgi:polyphosphate kinase 2 (PPK2 family)